MTWPRVLTEAETLDRLIAGASIARFGDGELKIACGGATVTHARNDKLAAELRAILRDPAPNLLPAIPRPCAVETRWKSWASQRDRWAKLMDPGRTYGSAFVGRHKVAPWIDTAEHRERFRSIWRGRCVVAVYPPTHPLPGWLLKDGALVVSIECPPREAYAAIDELESEVAAAGPDIAVICAGPAAKPLANRLTRLGIQAIDLGRGAGFIWKYRAPC